MIRKLAKPAVIYRACKININKHKKIKKFAKVMELGTMGTLATVQAGYLLRQPVVEEFVKTVAAPKSDIVISHLPPGIKMGPMPYVASKISTFKDSLFRIPSYKSYTNVQPVYNYVIKPVSAKEQLLQKNVVLKIMDDDKNLPQNLDKNKMASTILNIANELGADPITVACIIKQETHFKSGLNGGGPKGLMQITGITVKDMYQKGRDRLYHGALNDLKKDYPTHISLFKELQNQDSINIKVGTIAYMMRLQQSNGNVKTALRNYNGSSIKEKYATEVFENIQKYSAIYKKLKQEIKQPV